MNIVRFDNIFTDEGMRPQSGRKGIRSSTKAAEEECWAAKFGRSWHWSKTETDLAMFFKNQIRMEENPSLYTGARAAVPVASEVQKRRVEKVIDQLKIAYEKLAESSQER